MDLDKYGDSPHVYTPFMPVSTYITYVAAFLAVVAAIAMLIKWKLKKVPAEQVDNDSSHTLSFVPLNFTKDAMQPMLG